MTDSPQQTSTPRPTQRRGFLSTRVLLACVVLGGFTAVLILVMRPLGQLLTTTVPWLVLPIAPLPWLIVTLTVPILLPRFGTTLLTSVVAAVAGVGTFALVSGIVVELVFLLGRRIGRGGDGAADATAPRWALWAVVAGAGVGLVNSALMFTVREMHLLDTGTLLAGVVLRVVIIACYGLCAYALARALFRVGVDPMRVVPVVPARSTAAS